MKSILTLILAMGLSTSANAIWLQACFNHSTPGQAVSYSYESCINRNFREIERELPDFYGQYCNNIPRDQVSYFFVSCINNNFRSVERLLQGTFLSQCFNYDPERLDFSFTSCVERNYRAIERALNTPNP